MTADRSTSTGRVVVVGAGMAAVRLVEGLAARGVGATLLGEEAHAPYHRIRLSAALETGDTGGLELRPLDWYAEHGIDLRLGARVVGLDRDARTLALAGGREVAYDHLVLATGMLPTLPPIRGVVRPDGSLHPAVHAFRSLDDCRRLDAAVPAARRAVVVGGGVLGLQVARALAHRDLAVEVVEGGEHLLRSRVEGPAGAILARDLRRLGTEVYTGARAVRLGDDGLVLDNGAVLPTDLVVLTAGGRPSTALARGAGLAVRRGIVVDDHLATSDPAVHAVGDCAEHAGAVGGLVAPAWDQAAVLAERLAGGDAAYSGHRPVVRLRATDLDVAVLGDPVAAADRPGARVVEMTNPVAGSHRRIVVEDGRVVAATLVGDLARVGLITGHYDRGTRLADGEPGALLAADRPARPGTHARALPDDVEVCVCAGVTAGAVRACSSLDDVLATTRATTGCGGCADDVRSLLTARHLETTGGTR